MKNKQTRNLAVNLIILWLILLPITNITILVYATSQQSTNMQQPTQLIKESQSLRTNEFLSYTLNVTENSLFSISLQADHKVNFYLLDGTEFDKFRNGEDFQYYPEGTVFNTTWISSYLNLSSGKWYFAIVSNDGDFVKLNNNNIGITNTYFEVDYVRSGNSNTNISGISGIGLIISLFLYIYAIKSLWRMQKKYLWSAYLIFGLGILVNFFSFYQWGIDLLYSIDLIAIIQIIINSACIFWLYKNKALFMEDTSPIKDLKISDYLIIVGWSALVLMSLSIQHYQSYAESIGGLMGAAFWIYLPLWWIYRKPKSEKGKKPK